MIVIGLSCMFYVSQKTNIKWNLNGIKMDGELFWNIWDFPEEESMRNSVRGGHETGGAPPTPGRALGSRGPPVRQFMPFFCHKKANFMRKIWAKDSPQPELRISGYLRNGEGVESENAETER